MSKVCFLAGAAWGVGTLLVGPHEWLSYVIAVLFGLAGLLFERIEDIELDLYQARSQPRRVDP